MSNGQTNGIPQGSVLVDLIAEMVLGHADELLSSRLASIPITDYKILRFRDDYRIFVNNPQEGERILKELTEVLIDLGLKLNASKTTDALPVIQSSLKRDKIAWMKAKQNERNLQNHLLLIHQHGVDFPNAGSLLRGLDEFYKRVNRTKNISGVRQLVSLTVEIGLHSPRCFPICAAIISQLIARLSSKQEKLALLKRVYQRLELLPNNGSAELWMQRITYHFDKAITYKEPLCQLVEGNAAALWNDQWINDNQLQTAVDPSKLVNRTALRKLKPVMPRTEVSLFDSLWDS